ncbi:MBL fold metallo-hydrolase [Roseibium aggregatum]|uniref:beta-lactamase n=1 Tax=Roseibium aggregatum TaxID=187304 RepID=A0A926NTA4_9HYPH|nr:MBL fold metallo-hydrolase [Roseibium aggregatum]MBD1546034.1 MBL fold metallo-hydrolase [Roseibium aggregatum]
MQIIPTRLAAWTIAAIVSGFAMSAAAQSDTKPDNAIKRHTADTISMDPANPSYFGNFAPELAKTVARKPALDAETGLSVQEVKPGLFYVTDGIYQSAFLVTEDGIVVFDAPKSFADRLPAAIAQNSSGKKITTLIYSHDHADHIGGAGVFAEVPGLEVITSASVADSLESDGYPGVMAPTRTFEGHLELKPGGVDIQLDTAAYHSEDEDVIAYLPGLKFLIAIDTITPGEVPFMNFGATADFGRYLTVFDTLLGYDFDLLLPGHISVLGTRQDVIDNRDYAFDVRDTVLAKMETMYQRFGELHAATNYVNDNLTYRMAIEGMRNECAAEIIDRWSERLSVVDIYADSHCETAILYYIMH